MARHYSTKDFFRNTPNALLMTEGTKPVRGFTRSGVVQYMMR